ncbi:uncharacterized protein MONBRDRAFT_31124 [Monosiga brevicollis MX1]|uniref:DNA damage-binding protein 1 n=1 Tax=Monosiga brevicollis TaxID=81824 RepID=A9URW6_MONBE|nr:uncharacterized protein MONBRDRAFT_31124 [Monosiga brevicollis MX1]EDQ91677.1 predicted protein [Monosiga brevicollis MX1]|eukprot:XP_001742963.1 hypothetical protein [Monosiga brevicollis MX1]
MDARHKSVDTRLHHLSVTGHLTFVEPDSTRKRQRPWAMDADVPEQLYYVVSSFKPSAVTTAVRANFTAPDELNLLILKHSHLEVYKVVEEGLEPVMDKDLYGSVLAMNVIRLPGWERDAVFLLTSTFRFFILASDEDNGVVTVIKGNALSSCQRPADCGVHVAVHPKGNCIFVSVYPGNALIIPFDASGEPMEAYSVFVPVSSLLDATFVNGAHDFTLALLSDDDTNFTSLKMFHLDVEERTLVEEQLADSTINTYSSRLLPLWNLDSGVLVLGEELCHVVTPSGIISSNLSESLPVAAGIIDTDGSRILIGDELGDLHLLVLEGIAERRVTSIVRQHLGRISTPSAIVYLDNGVVYIGSDQADCQLIQLLSHVQAEADNKVKVLQEYPNIGPIVDFEMVDLDGHGQQQVVSCCGSNQDGCLRILRKGVGIDVLASLDLEGLQDLWCLRSASNLGEDQHDVLALKFLEQTAFLSLAGDEVCLLYSTPTSHSYTELDGVDVAGANTELPALHCGNVRDGMWLVVTSQDARLLDAVDRTEVTRWSPPNGKGIDVCASTGDLLAVASGSDLYALSLSRTEGLHDMKNATLDHEIACLSIRASGPDQGAGTILAGLWTDFSLRAFSTRTLEEQAKVEVPTQVVSSSVASVTMEGTCYFFIGHGDGKLAYGVFDPLSSTFGAPHVVQVGSLPVKLRACKRGKDEFVFVATDRPMVVSSRRGKLLFCNVSAGACRTADVLNAEAYVDCLAYVEQDRLVFGKMENMQNLQIRKIPLDETPLGVTYHKSSGAFCVATDAARACPTPQEPICYLRLIDAQSFEVRDSFKLEQAESLFGHSLHTMQLRNDSTEYIVVGTAMHDPNRPLPKQGRILVLRVNDDGKLELVVSHAIHDGGIFSLQAFRDGVVAGINGRLEYFSLESTPLERKVEVASQTVFRGMQTVSCLGVCGNTVLVGDILQSVTAVNYSEQRNRFVVGPGDPESRYLLTCFLPAEDRFLFCDSDQNLVLGMPPVDTVENDASLMHLAGRIHIGDNINSYVICACIHVWTPYLLCPDSTFCFAALFVTSRFAFGSLSLSYERPAEAGEAGEDGAKQQSSPPIVFTTVLGGVGMILEVQQKHLWFMHEMQRRLADMGNAVGGLTHEDYRSTKNGKRESVTPARCFVDGNLIESFLELTPEEMEEVMKEFHIPNSSNDFVPVTVSEASCLLLLTCVLMLTSVSVVFSNVIMMIAWHLSLSLSFSLSLSLSFSLSHTRAQPLTGTMTTLKFQLDLRKRSLGMTIQGGIDHPVDGSTHVIVNKLAFGGAAAAAGLQVGDWIQSINGSSTTNATLAEAASHIKKAIPTSVRSLASCPAQHIPTNPERDRVGVPAHTCICLAFAPFPAQSLTLVVYRATDLKAVTSGDEQAAGLINSDRTINAQRAFNENDPLLSRLVHDMTSATEQHLNEAGQYVKAAVFGGLDGIITTFAVVASSNGARLSANVIVIMGVANLLADGLAMGMGEYLSSLSELQYARSERQREEWELENYEEGEISEMVELYMEKGIEEEDARQILHIMSKYKDFFVDHMLVQELGIMPPDEDESPFKNGVVMFLAFISFGLVPLLSYLMLQTVNFGSMDKDTALFAIACGFTGLAMFVLGAIKSKFSQQSWFMSGLTVLVNGGAAAGAAYLVGWLLEKYVGHSTD